MGRVVYSSRKSKAEIDLKKRDEQWAGAGGNTLELWMKLPHGLMAFVLPIPYKQRRRSCQSPLKTPDKKGMGPGSTLSRDFNQVYQNTHSFEALKTA